jgi:putative acyl-CoA dehydrogenase
VEAGVVLMLRLAQAFDLGERDPQQRLFARIATAVAKFWTNKRAPQAIYEAMECLGGGGYIEESILPRLYREAPVNSIWEGSGNVICLDVLRAMQKNPDTVTAFLQEVELGRGGHRLLDTALDRLHAELNDPVDAERRARRITALMAMTLQGSLLVRQAPSAVAHAFCVSRLGPEPGLVHGAPPGELEPDMLLERVLPE